MPVKKVAASTTKPTVKKATRKTTSPAKKITTNIQVASNTRHIAENTQEIKGNSNMVHIMYGIIIVLMMIIAGLAYYVGSLSGTNNTSNENNTPTYSKASDITVTIIDDKRCSNCQTSTLAEKIKLLPFLAGATFIEKDFSEK